MAGFNEAQRRHLVATFRYVDGLLGQAASRLAASGAPAAFPDCAPDATPVQAKVVEDSVARCRAALCEGLAVCGIAPPPPVTGAVWSARALLTSAEIAVEELSPGAMRGYGEVAPEAAERLAGVAAALSAQLRRMSRYLAQGPGRDLQARLERLQGLASGDFDLALLRRLEQVVTAQGLIELRPALDLLIARLEAPSFEIAVFGRVSSGKSSLLNRLLRRDLLPVGVTPVTAVPVLIAYGSEPGAVVELAGGERLAVPLDGLAAYAGEEQNPGNAKHVASLRVTVDEPRLAAGVTLVDTPGLGSIAARGAAETLAYLPRCDLGVVLVDAAATLDLADLAVVESLLAAAAEVRVLLSKADLLSAADRERALRYTKDQIRAQCGVEVAVAAVSAVGAAAAAADEWFEAEIVPLMSRHREAAMAALGRKVEALRQAVDGALDDRRRRQAPAEWAAAAPPAGAADANDPAQPVLGRAAALLDGAERCCDAVDGLAAGAVHGLIDRVAADLAVRWPGEGFRPELPAEILAAAVSRDAAAAASRLAACLAALADELAAALAAAGEGASPLAGHPLPRPSGMPVLDAEQLASGLRLERPVLAFLGRRYLRSWARDELRRRAAPALAEALSTYRKLLARWSETFRGDLRQVFEARAESLRAGPPIAKLHPKRGRGRPLPPGGREGERGDAGEIQ
jgi:GTP-binding protein EngB required for normal cell division